MKKLRTYPRYILTNFIVDYEGKTKKQKICKVILQTKFIHFESTILFISKYKPNFVSIW